MITISAPYPHDTGRMGADFAGTRQLLRLCLRRDRIVLPLWVLILGVLMPMTYAGSIEAVYPTTADLAKFAAATAASPAQIAMYGPIFNASLGAVAIWKAGALHTVIAVAVILTVVRHTRAEEEAGRAELIASTSIGRYAGLTAALALTAGASVVTGASFGLVLYLYNLPPAGSVGFGSALAASGLVYTGVAAVAAQLTTSARPARGIALGTVGVFFALRAVGDAGSGPLSWLSPQGWSLQLRPFADERWWVLLLHVAATAATIATAYMLLRRRDLGGGLIAERPGEKTAGPTLAGPVGLAWRMHRGTLLAWSIALLLYGLLFGSAAHGLGNQLGDSQTIGNVLARLGGTTTIEDAFVALALTMLGIAASAYAISATLRLHYEETAHRAEPVIAGQVGRIRWASSHLLFAALGPAVALVIAGLAVAVTYGAAVGDVAGTLPATVGGALVQLPAIWICVGVTMALFGWLPRITPAAWAIYVAFLLIFTVGSLADLPPWVLDLEPFGHLPKLPGAAFTPAPVMWETLIAVALIVAGALGFRRRDLR
ncbi:ABC transporter permease [Rhodococcus chondri]|uniref:ABC transporter permease n=1 Tax=Rhodococcus chondri TaxID=3065941 RepID=A0ABU7JYP9_9NOCA|nr:ABC transporter permease [Rhodococcus sp. CC-R104]MEE2035049.1 ABC transporter permease [Rhodococcus sp. CC-R104]